MVYSNTLIFFVNGKKIIEENADPGWTLLYYLRTKLKLTGTKLGCGEGGCGACTVMISKIDRQDNQIKHLACNACLMPICAVHGLAITTVEGIGSTRTRLHPVQERIAKSHGSQCGFCTPGIVMSMYSLLRNSPKPSLDDIEISMQGNLCRCTGYRPIMDGLKSFTEEWEIKQLATNGNVNGTQNGVCALGENCCKNQTNQHEETEDNILFDPKKCVPFDPSQEPIFPPELIKSSILDQQFLKIKGPEILWYRPTTLDQLIDLISSHPDAKIVVGNTEVGVETKFKNLNYPIIIHTNLISELRAIETTEVGVQVGASVTLQELEDYLKAEIKKHPEFKTRIIQSIVKMLYWFAGKQIRNVASIGGNIITSSPISDLNPIFLAGNCTLDVVNKKGMRSVEMNEHFFTGYRTNLVGKDDILLRINIPFCKENQYFCAFKQSKRRDDDIAIVNLAMSVEISSLNYTINDIKLAYGGMAPTTVMALKTSNALKNRRWNNDILELAYSNLLLDLPLSPDAPGGMVQYRRALSLSLFLKGFLNINEMHFPNLISINDNEKSGALSFEPIPSISSQYFAVPPNRNKIDVVGRPIVHKSAFQQTTGEAMYCDDIPKFQDELYLGFVLSNRPHARLLSIDASAALTTPGVKAFFSSKDLNQENNIKGLLIPDEELFISEKVTSFGQTLGIIVADDPQVAKNASKKVVVEYEDIEPVIVSIEDAIKRKSYFTGFPKEYKAGDIESGFALSDQIITGSCRIGGQEHFYLETQCTLVVPRGEDDELELFCSTQCPSDTTKMISHVLGIPRNRVVTRTKRMGGGFGGKETSSYLVSLPTAFAAYRLNKPVRCMLDREDDMLMTGGRNPFLFKYKVGITNEGKINACDIEIYVNAGYSVDVSSIVAEICVYHILHAYNVKHYKATVFLCKTNLPTNTAFRGFGAPQGLFASETIIKHIAEHLNKDSLEICTLNMHRVNDITIYNQEITECSLDRCLDECLRMSQYEEKKKEVDIFNKNNRWKKRGISVQILQHGAGFEAAFMNQAGALVHIYTDGSVLISHGGTEMGQGLHTKMIQVASKGLGIPVSEIHIAETSTDKVPNATPTGASASSDMYGMAILNACDIINERLRPYKEKNPKGSWKDWINAAYFDRTSLSTTGFYKTPNLDCYNWETGEGKRTYVYYTYGAGCSLVEIDCLTGDHQVLKTDIVMDLGESLNPAIDIGQIEGAFMQGYGLLTIEEMMYSPKGMVLTRGPGTYKIPSFSSIPNEFNVSLLKGSKNVHAVYSSKAVGEPPLFLASSVFFAIREAIKAARSEIGENSYFQLDAPATACRIRVNCTDHLMKKVKEAEKETDKLPWNIVP